MANVIVVLLIVAMLAAAVAYIIKEKKRGVRCVGCSAAGECPHHHSETTGCGGCACHTEKQP